MLCIRNTADTWCKFCTLNGMFVKAGSRYNKSNIKIKRLCTFEHNLSSNPQSELLHHALSLLVTTVERQMSVPQNTVQV